MMNNNPNKLDPQQLAAEFKEIPPMPNVMIKALNIIKNPTTGIAELAKIMQVDQAISTKTLSLVNSAFYGFRQQITSINKALVVLGMMKAKNIIMSLALKQMMTAQGSRELWEHSIKCAVAAEILAKEYKVINPDDAFVIAFLHDIGKMLLNSKNPLKYSKVRYLASQGNVDLVEIEPEFDDPSFNTVSGWVVDNLNRFAQVVDTFNFKNLTIKVLNIDDFIVNKIEVIINKEENSED